MIVLDTATWLWVASEPSRLSPRARELFESVDVAFVSAISAWEVGMLVSKRRIVLDRPVGRWVDEALRISKMEIVPVDERIAVLATQLAGAAPGDPADRIISATALVQGCPLVTPDRALGDYPFVPTVW